MFKSNTTILELKSNPIAKRRLYKAYRCTTFGSSIFSPKCTWLQNFHRPSLFARVSHGVATLISDAWVWQVITIRLGSQLSSHWGASHIVTSQLTIQVYWYDLHRVSALAGTIVTTHWLSWVIEFSQKHFNLPMQILIVYPICVQLVTTDKRK